MTTILSVDDDPTNQVVVQKLLAAHFNVIQAMSGEEALNIISNSAKPPDFVLLDVMMPKMSGLEVCEKVREKFPMCDLPIIMVSAKSSPRHIVEGLSKGANDYMAKPINRDELLARIRAQLMICHTCRMVCKNVSSDDPFFLCDNCKLTKPKAASRRPSLDFVTDLVNELPNTIEILTHVPFGITLYSTEGRALMRNAEARRQFEGLPEAAPFQNTPFLPHVLDRSTAEQILYDVKQGGKFEKNVEIYSPSTTVYHRIFAKSIALSIPQQNLEGTYVLVVEWDVTEWWRKREEAARLRASDRQKSELIFDLAHNLKAPLSGLAALAADESASPRGVSLSTVALHMARMVDEIADFAEATNSLDDQHRAKNTPTQVIEVLDTVDTLFIPTYRTKGITVVRELSPTPPPTVLVQRHKLTLLLSYLLDVSIHYSSSRMIRIRAYAGVDNTTAVVSFSDNLRSCSQEELEELFAKSPIQGYLAPVIVRKVADAIGATITFSPLAQGGSSINVLIPEVCLTAPVKERRPARRSSLSSASPLPPRLQLQSNSPTFTRKKDRMDTIPEVSESPPIKPPKFTTTPSTPTTSASTRRRSSSPTVSSATTHSPHLLPSKSPPTNSIAAQLISSHSPTTSPSPIPHPSIPAAISLPSPSLSSAPQTPQYTPQTPQTPLTPQLTPRTPQASSISSHYASGHAFLFGTPDENSKTEKAPPSSTNIHFEKHDDMQSSEKQSLENEIKELEAKLAMAKSLYKIKKLSVKFKCANQPFFHLINLEENSIAKLRNLIAKRLRLLPGQQIVLVRDGDILVELDEDVENGMILDVYVT